MQIWHNYGFGKIGNTGMYSWDKDPPKLENFKFYFYSSFLSYDFCTDSSICIIKDGLCLSVCHVIYVYANTYKSNNDQCLG